MALLGRIILYALNDGGNLLSPDAHHDSEGPV